MSFILLGILNSQAAGAGGAGAYDLLETTVLTSSASSVSFTGLDSYSDYKHLQIRATLQSTSSADVDIQFNGDSTAANYYSHYLKGTGSSVFSIATAGKTTGANFEKMSANDFNGSHYGAAVIDILDFNSSSKNTTIRTLYGMATISQDWSIRIASGLWNNTAAVTSMVLTPTASFTSGSRFSLYGIK